MQQPEQQINHAIFLMLNALFEQQANVLAGGATSPYRERALMAYRTWLEYQKEDKAK